MSKRRTAALGLAFSLAACIGPQSLDQPLSPMVVRGALVGRVVLGSENGQPTFMLRLARNGLAARDGGVPEYGRWRTDESGAFCLWWHDEAERCAPIYAAPGSHYRWGTIELSVMSER